MAPTHLAIKIFKPKLFAPGGVALEAFARAQKMPIAPDFNGHIDARACLAQCLINPPVSWFREDDRLRPMTSHRCGEPLRKRRHRAVGVIEAIVVNRPATLAQFSGEVPHR